MVLAAHLSRLLHCLVLSLLLSSLLLTHITGPAAAESTDSASSTAPASIAVQSTGSEIVVEVKGAGTIPYQVHIARDVFTLSIVRDGQTVLKSAQATAALSATRAGAVVTAGQVLDDTYTGSQLSLHAAASDGGEPFSISATPGGDRIAWQVSLPGAQQVTLSLDLASSGHWYGHGEGGNDSGLWPLDDAASPIHAADFSPTSYDMDEPFWFTSQSTGLWINTSAAMAVSIDATPSGTHRADFTVKAMDTLKAVTFIERTPRDVYADYVGIAGKAAKSDATDKEYAEPVWNTWAMYGSQVTQADVIAYAQNIKAAGLGGYAIQIDDRWSSKYGDFAFDRDKFPDPRAMTQQIHDLGFDLGLWVTLWINLDSDNYAIARDNGYLLKSAADPAQPCTVKWWRGHAGIVDLGNPAAAAWIRGQLHGMQSTYNIQGYKFDTRFFDPSCAGASGLNMSDYQRLGAELADEFDLQGVGIRAHWTGQQKYGFIVRAVDATPDFSSTGLARSIRQALSLSVLGYPFVVTDMVGGSAGGNPTDEVLVRWAQAEVALPFWYASTSPAGPFTLTRAYTPETTALYQAAVNQHRALAPYILKQAQRAVAEGEPIIKPLFFNYPQEPATYTLSDEWLLGDALLSAPVMTSAASRPVYLPSGTWYDVNTHTLLLGPQTIASYAAPLSVLPLFIRMDDPDAKDLVSIFNANRPVPSSAFLSFVQSGIPTEIIGPKLHP